MAQTSHPQKFTPVGIDNFSSLDACIIDLDREICTFIKLQ